MVHIRAIIESRRFDADGDLKVGLKRAAEQVEQMLHRKKEHRLIQPSDLSIRELFEEFVVEKAVEEQGQDVRAILHSGSSAKIAEAIQTSQFPRLMNRMSEITLLDEYEKSIENVFELVDEDDINGSVGYYSRPTGKEGPELVHEGEAYEEAQMSGALARVRARKFGRVIKLTKEMVLEDRTSRFLKLARDYGDRMAVHQQKDILATATGKASPVHDGGANDNFVVNDTAYPLYANDHSGVPESGGQANDNLDIVGAVTPIGYQKALAQFRKIKDQDGDNIWIRPTHVIVGADDEIPAWRLYNQNQQVTQVASTGIAMEDSPYKGRFKPIVDLSISGNEWYMGEYSKQLMYVWTWKPMTETLSAGEQSILRDIVMITKCSYKGGCGAVDHRSGMKMTGADA